MLDPDPITRIDWYDLFNHPAFSEEDQVYKFFNLKIINCRQTMKI